MVYILDCSKTEFKYRLHTMSIDAEDFCSGSYNNQFKQTYDDPVDRFTMVQRDQQYLIDNFNLRLSGVQMLHDQPHLCEKKVEEDIAVITFEIESPTAVVAEHDVTFTFFDKIGIFGIR